MSGSVDLRERALAAWEGGMATREVMATFQVARSTLYRWHEQQQQQGHLRSGTSPGGGRRITAERDATLLAQVQKHPDAYLRETRICANTWFDGSNRQGNRSASQPCAVPCCG